MDRGDEEKKLLDSEDNEESTPSYGASVNKQEGASVNAETRPKGGFIYRHRDKIPGYGVYRMVRGVKPYALYVLLMMLLVYLLNQLDRYTLPIVTTSVGYDLRYGDQVCMANRHLNSTLAHEAGNISELCTDTSYNSSWTDETYDIK